MWKPYIWGLFSPSQYKKVDGKNRRKKSNLKIFKSKNRLDNYMKSRWKKYCLLCMDQILQYKLAWFSMIKPISSIILASRDPNIRNNTFLLIYFLCLIQLSNPFFSLNILKMPFFLGFFYCPFNTGMDQKAPKNKISTLNFS